MGHEGNSLVYQLIYYTSSCAVPFSFVYLRYKHCELRCAQEGEHKEHKEINKLL